MKKSIQNLNQDHLKNLGDNFNLGMAEKPSVSEQDLPSQKEGKDLCLPPQLVNAFQSGLAEEPQNCDCDCGCGEGHDCQDASASAHSGCGGCNHHG